MRNELTPIDELGHQLDLLTARIQFEVLALLKPGTRRAFSTDLLRAAIEASVLVLVDEHRADKRRAGLARLLTKAATGSALEREALRQWKANGAGLVRSDVAELLCRRRVELGRALAVLGGSGDCFTTCRALEAVTRVDRAIARGAELDLTELDRRAVADYLHAARPAEIARPIAAMFDHAAGLPAVMPRAKAEPTIEPSPTGALVGRADPPGIVRKIGPGSQTARLKSSPT